MIIYRQKDYSFAGTRLVAGINKSILRKSPMAAKRAAIKTQDKALGVAAKGLNTIEHGKAKLYQTALNPGSTVNEVTEATLRHPITAGTNVVGKATMIVDPTGTGLIPMGAIGTAAETGLRKWSPRYAKVTDKLANKYKGSTTSKYVEGGVNGLVGGLKAVAG